MLKYRNKKGYMIISIVMVLLASILLNLQSSLAEQTEFVECYIPGASDCTTLSGTDCTNSAGIPQNSQNSEICEQGCCCYTASNNNKASLFDVAKKFCVDEKKAQSSQFIPKTANSFTTGTYSPYTATSCNDYCQQQKDIAVPKTGTACDDGIDNDGDGKTDFGNDVASNDLDCSSKEMNSELGIGACLKAEVTAECDCGGKKCSVDQFCYDSNPDSLGKECTNEPPKNCKQGDTLAVSIDDEGCQQVVTCVNNGQYGNPEKKNCPKIEICDDAQDNNDNSENNCADIDCNGLKCADSSAVSPVPETCKIAEKTYAKYVKGNNFWVCCTGESKDCSGDGIPDSCEQCPMCQDATDPKPFVIKSVNHAAGKKEIILNYDTNSCPVPVTLYRCVGAKEECLTPLTAAPGKWAEQDNAKNTLLTDLVNVVEANKNYCYSVQANYPNAAQKIFSAVVCESSGSEICLTTPYQQKSEFCIKTPLKDFTTFDTEIYFCDEKNQLKFKGNNNANDDTFCGKQGKGKYCYGPDQQGKASCVYQSACIFCGTPFNMYATKESILLKNDDDYNEKLCMNIPLCYYETTKTVNDAFDECKGVNACSNYKTEQSCSQLKIDLPETLFNNKCLTRDCVWSTLYSEIGIGICKETDIDFNSCRQCEESALNANAIFDYCDVKKCTEFSSEQIRCYKAGTAKDDLTCSPEPDVACDDFSTPEECHKGEQSKIDVQYSEGKRIAGTNKILESSINFMNIPTCYWDPIKQPDRPCFKDANGDGFKDQGLIYDITPPKTIIVTPSLKTRMVDLSFSITDDSVRGRPSSGIKETYYCHNKAINPIDNSINPPCYPDKLYELEPDKPLILPIDHGLYNLYYYSVDNANNIEEVQSVTIDVDRKSPEITMKYVVISDTNYPYIDSTVIITVTVDEQAMCSDKFEGSSNSEIDKDTGKAFQVKYNNLEDGIYRYTVSCTDILGNKGETSFLLKVDADLMIQNTKPTGILADGEIILEATTLAEAVCTVGGIAFEEKQEIEIPTGKAYKHLLKIKSTESKEYIYPISCMINNQQHEDEIQFVLDKQAPKTTIIDINAKLFDTTLFYTGTAIAEKLFFSCTDEPLVNFFGPSQQTAQTTKISIGFSCDKTYFCITENNALCDPDPAKPENTYNPIYSIDAAFSQASKQWLCYKSQEKIIDSKGGLFEEKNCVKFQIDSFQPVIDVDYLAEFDSPANPKQWYGKTYDLGITITDEDAIINPPADNKITVEVINIEADQTIFTESRSANEKVQMTVTLAQGLNEIKITATDRSNTQVSRSYYILSTTTSEQLIQLVLPINGMSETPEFDFKIKLKEGFEITAKECSMSQSEHFIPSNKFNDGNGKTFTEKIKLDIADQGIPKLFYVKCLLQGSAETTEKFTLVFDNTTPIITSLTIVPSNNKDPPAITEFPIKTNITVKTDDLTQCKFTINPDFSYSNMAEFPDYNKNALKTTNKQDLSNEYQATDILHRIDDKKDRTDNKDSYTYYIQCDNGLQTANHISEKKQLTFKVDTSYDKGMNFLSPPVLTSVKKHKFILETEKQVEYCSFGQTETDMTGNLTTTKQGDKTNKHHESKEFEFKDGKYTYYFSCKLLNANEFMNGYHSFTIDTTPPVFKSIDDGITTSSIDTLSAVFNYEDNDSSINYYEFSIGAKQGSIDIYSWKNTTDSKVTVKGLKLINKTKYFWNVKATNNVGLTSKVSSSDGITVSTEYIAVITKPDPIDLCKNNKKDTNETGTDCGGNCPSCSNKDACVKDSDCASKKCSNGICKKASCEDTMQNQDESDIDCGGIKCEACEKGKACGFQSDCATNFCEKNICTQPSCFDGKRNGDEKDIDCGGKTCEACEGEEPEISDKSELTEEPVPEEGGASIWTILLLILLFIILSAGGGYYYYIKFMQKPSFTSAQLPPLNLSSPSQPLSAQQHQSSHQSAGRFMPISAELRKKKEELRKKQHQDIIGKFDSLGTSAKKDTPKLQEKAEIKPEQKINQPLIKSSSPPQSAVKPTAIKSTAQKQDTGKQPTAKQDPLAALAKTVKGKSGNAIEELRKKVKK